jgi:hypothetical protein
MPGLVPAILVLACEKKYVDARDKPGHDDQNIPAIAMLLTLPNPSPR